MAQMEGTKPQSMVIEDLKEALKNLLRWSEAQVCLHEDTYRGGVLWEICHSCGAKWADDEGGRPEFTEPPAIEQARDLLYELEKDRG